MSRGAALRGVECVAHFWAAAVNTLMGVLAVSGHQADTGVFIGHDFKKKRIKSFEISTLTGHWPQC